MCRHLVLSFILSLGAVFAFAQQDPEAKKILDRCAKKAESSYPLSLEFEYLYESQPDNFSESNQGSILIDRNRFKLSLPEMEIYCDGSTYWNYLVENKEVYVSDPADAGSEDIFFSNPAGIFTMYNDNFKYRLKGEIEINGVALYEVHLFPLDLNKSYHTIKLLIDKNTYQLHSMQTLEKQGVIHTITITAFHPGIKPAAGSFVFKPEEHPDVEVVDTRL
jgi:outer membrane lipoprotein-sorting protein